MGSKKKRSSRPSSRSACPRGPSLREQATQALDESLPIAENLGPQTTLARERLTLWLSTGRVKGGLRQVRSDIFKLTTIVRTQAWKKKR